MRPQANSGHRAASADAAPNVTTGRAGHPFDGFRALLCLLVIVGHLELAPFLAGGQSRVIAFFSLSGFLITAILIKRYESSGTISFRDFYVSRLGRFIPTLFVVSALGMTCALIAKSGWGSALSVEFSEVMAALPRLWTQTINLSLIDGATDLPYEFVPGWSLGVEWQFYFIWPIVMLGILRAFGIRAVGWFALGTAILGFAWSIWLALSIGLEDPRVAYGSDTRGAAILLGCAMAVLVRNPGAKSWLKEHCTVIVALASATLVLLFTQLLFDSGPHMTTWGQIVVALAVSLLAGVLWVKPTTARVLCAAPLVWLGQRSLGLFLFHVPVMQILGGPGDLGRTLLIVLVTLLLVHLSYRWLDQPLLARVDRLRDRWRSDYHVRQIERASTAA